MVERKSWSEKEDQILKILREERMMKKWSQIADAMHKEFHLSQRNGKQCRERYHNHLDSGILKGNWSIQERDTLLRLHNQYGNRWAQISRQLPGRTDNSVKNYFYSTFRRAIKNMNKKIMLMFKKVYKPIKECLINKIIEKMEECLGVRTLEKEEILNLCIDLKGRIFTYETNENSELDELQDKKELENLIKSINTFSKKYRKKRKVQKKAKLIFEEFQDFSLFQDNFQTCQKNSFSSSPHQKQELIFENQSSIFQSEENLALESNEKYSSMELKESRLSTEHEIILMELVEDKDRQKSSQLQEQSIEEDNYFLKKLMFLGNQSIQFN